MPSRDQLHCERDCAQWASQGERNNISMLFSRTPANGTPEQKVEFRRKRFNRAVDWAENQQLIAIEEIGGVTYLRLVLPESDDEDGKG